MLELCKEALYEVAFLVEAPIAGMRASSLGSWWNDRNSASVQNGVVEVFGIIGSVGDDVAGIEAMEQFLAINHIATVSRCKYEAHR